MGGRAPGAPPPRSANANVYTDLSAYSIYYLLVFFIGEGGGTFPHPWIR